MKLEENEAAAAASESANSASSRALYCSFGRFHVPKLRQGNE